MAFQSWDDEVAMVAQTYAEACKVNVHDGNLQRSIPGKALLHIDGLPTSR